MFFSISNTSKKSYYDHDDSDLGYYSIGFNMNKNLASLARRVVYFTVKNPIAARSVVNHLIKKPNDSIILPFIDYPGPIAREILSKEFGSLTVCETEDETREKFRVSNTNDKDFCVFL